MHRFLSTGKGSSPARGGANVTGPKEDHGGKKGVIHDKFTTASQGYVLKTESKIRKPTRRGRMCKHGGFGRGVYGGKNGVGLDESNLVEKSRALGRTLTERIKRVCREGGCNAEIEFARSLRNLRPDQKEPCACPRRRVFQDADRSDDQGSLQMAPDLPPEKGDLLDCLPPDLRAVTGEEMQCRETVPSA